MSLSWGTGQMAAELALEHVGRRAAVLGCGMVGLTCTRQLQRRGFDVTIYAMAVPPHTTSNMSLAGWTPTSGLVNFRTRTPEWEAQFRQAATIAYREHQLLAGSRYGVSWIDSYAPTDDAQMATGTNILLPDALQGAKLLLQPGEHPFPTKYALQIPMMRFEPSIYLNALVKDVQLYGARIVIRKFDAMRDLMSLTEPIVVNCTGLGAKDLFSDDELVPLKGQLTSIITPARRPFRDVRRCRYLDWGHRYRHPYDAALRWPHPRRNFRAGGVVARRQRGRAAADPRRTHRALRCDARDGVGSCDLEPQRESRICSVKFDTRVSGCSTVSTVRIHVDHRLSVILWWQ